MPGGASVSSPFSDAATGTAEYTPRLEGALAAPAPLLKMTCSCQKLPEAVRVDFSPDLSPHAGRRQTAIALSPGRWRRGQHPLWFGSVPAQPPTMVKTMRNTKECTHSGKFPWASAYRSVCWQQPKVLPTRPTSKHSHQCELPSPFEDAILLSEVRVVPPRNQAPAELGEARINRLCTRALKYSPHEPEFGLRCHGDYGSNAGAGKENSSYPAHRHGAVA